MKTFKEIRENNSKFKATNPTKDVSGYPEAKDIVGKIIKFKDIDGAGAGVGTTRLAKGKAEKNANRDGVIQVIKKHKVKGFRFGGDFMKKEVAKNKNLEYPTSLAKKTGLVKSVGDYDASKFLLDVIEKSAKAETKGKEYLNTDDVTMHFIEI